MGVKGGGIQYAVMLSYISSTLIVSVLFSENMYSVAIMVILCAVTLAVLPHSIKLSHLMNRTIKRIVLNTLCIVEGVFYLYFYCDFVKTVSLKDTPLIVIFMLLLLPTIYISSVGVESLSSAARFATPFIAVFFLALILTNIDVETLSTLSLDDTSGAQIYAVIFIVHTFLVKPLLIFPVLFKGEGEKVLQNGISKGLIFGAFFCSAGIVTTFLLLGQSLIANIDYPFYYATSLARTGSLERFEALVCAVLVVSSVVNVALLIMSVARNEEF